jgi:coenzyme F420-0:L-glutamate ligase / coenzyme F420-1:gamma-L-glutamate ligase
VSTSQKTLIFTTIEDFPRVKKDDDLVEILINLLNRKQIEVKDGDIFVFAQKVISKAEGRLVNFSEIQPSETALELGKITQKDPRFIQLVLNESRKVIRAKHNTLIVEHKRGFICANAGIDHSNIGDHSELSDEWALLLPEDPDRSAQIIQKSLQDHFQKQLGVLIIDSHGRAWRNGTVGVCIGIAGLPGLVDLRGQQDLVGFKLKVTTVGAADELAAGASLLMGQAAEGTPVILARGFPYALRDSKLDELIRPEEEDLFR